MLSIISRPAPGMANTVSVMTAPPSSVPMMRPNRVTVEISALRSTWRTSTIRGAQALGAGEVDILGAEHLDDRGAQVAHQHGGEAQRQRQRRQEEV